MRAITVAEMARELGVGQRKVYEMLRGGQIPHIRIGARYIVSRAAFYLWLSTLGMQQLSASKEAVLQ
jgi:excisionase family DNA binding protein